MEFMYTVFTRTPGESYLETTQVFIAVSVTSFNG